MTRRSSSSQSTRNVVILAAIILAAIFLARLIGFDLGPLENIVEPEGTQSAEAPTAEQPIQPTQESTVEQPGQPTEEPVLTSEGGGGYYHIYFTEPVPEGGALTGGIDGHLVALIGSAKSSVDIAFFEFNLPSVAQALIAAHQRGVQVRVVYDDEHTDPEPPFTDLLDAGIPATPDRRGDYMHDKFAVIDGTTVWTGSWNMTVNGTYYNNNNVIVIISPRLAQNYTAEFEEMFGGAFGPTSPANTPNPQITIDGTVIENYFAPEDDVMPKVVEEVLGATDSIHFMAFSFTHSDLSAAMLDRAAAGVEVAGIFEERGANASYGQCPVLLAAGQFVRLDGNPRTFHHKVIIIDGKTVILGSFNFSNSANEDNDENLLIIHDPNVAAAYEAEFNRRLAESVAPVGGQCLAE
jgi:phosphatidylserine/phosphatidylglycerophosphate/cardiolipin synthase-like enzyme